MIYSFLGTFKINKIEAYSWLKETLSRIPGHSIRKLQDLLTNWQSIITIFTEKLEASGRMLTSIFYFYRCLTIEVPPLLLTTTMYWALSTFNLYTSVDEFRFFMLDGDWGSVIASTGLNEYIIYKQIKTITPANIPFRKLWFLKFIFMSLKFNYICKLVVKNKNYLSMTAIASYEWRCETLFYF